LLKAMGGLKTALVLGGGAARGAYEAGILSYLRDELEPELGRPLPLDIISGTSVGAIHACFLAATAAEPASQGRVLIEQWRRMRVHEVLDFGVGDVFRLLREALGKPPTGIIPRTYGGLVNVHGIERLLLDSIPWRDIGRNLRSGRLEALSVSATHVGSGRTTVFIQQRQHDPLAWTVNPHFHAVPARIGPKHALASAAIPVVFPSVRVRGRLYVDGGLRLNVPLSPAVRFGAQRVAVISLRSEERILTQARAAGVVPASGVERAHDLLEERAYATAPFLFGKALDAMMLDRTDQDLERLERINHILEAGTRAYGKDFAREMNDAMPGPPGPPMRYVRTLLIRPSHDLGALAARYARSPEFRSRCEGLAGRTILRLVDREAAQEADLVSYLLFDGGFADLLIELGRKDARAQREAWIRFWSEAPESHAEAALLEEARASVA
jgi:NTE family protein